MFRIHTQRSLSAVTGPRIRGIGYRFQGLQMLLFDMLILKPQPERDFNNLGYFNILGFAEFARMGLK
jgi:hypothetical protein